MLRRPPMYELAPRHYVFAGAAAIVAAALFGLVGALVLPPRPFGGGILRLGIALLLGVGGGALLARALDVATSRKRGRALQLMAAGAFVGATLLRLVLSGELDLATRDTAGWVMVIAGVVVSWSRLE